MSSVSALLLLRRSVTSAVGMRRLNLLPSTAVRAMGYAPEVLDHYNKPRNVGSLDESDENVGTGLVGAPACGDVMKLQIKVERNEDGQDVIVDARFKTFGCGSAIASSSLATEWLKGKKIDDASSIRDRDIAAHLKLPPVKLHCSMLAQDAIQSAIANLQSKREVDEDSADDSQGAVRIDSSETG